MSKKNAEPSLVNLTEKRFTLDEVFEYSIFGRKEPFQYGKRTRREYEGVKVKMDSMRYEVFKRNPACVWCGLKGQFFLLQQFRGGTVEYGHFNLYAEENGKLVMLTKDHKRPKAKGGRDTLPNMQTMCVFCNSLKGNRSDGTTYGDEDWLGLEWFENGLLLPWVSVRRLLTSARKDKFVRNGFLDFLRFYDRYPGNERVRKWMYENHELLFSLVQFHVRRQKSEEKQVGP